MDLDCSRGHALRRVGEERDRMKDRRKRKEGMKGERRRRRRREGKESQRI